ncbi:glycosyltransferase family 2 protein [Propionicimonas sp.]|uniref:glycosyltransferase family 2 protein n=1 Tax=Propionicimonas sp. TaxID=1955623 RepID=UPI0039E52B4E
MVVTYNRFDLLRQVLSALQGQTRPVDRILVIDNGSTDGTRPYLEAAAEAGGLALVEAGSNLGGSGGFARGLAWASTLGADWIWLMDDDAIPARDCLEVLLSASEGCGFVAPQVVDATGATGPRNYPTLSSSFADHYEAAGRGLVAIVAATFVGPLIAAPVAAGTHLPLDDFFIWHDDMEYTARLGSVSRAYAVPDAKIAHLAQNPGPAHYNGERNYYNIRNYIWWYREVRHNHTFNSARILVALARTSATQFNNAPKKLPYLRVVVKALADGVAGRPAHRDVAEVVSRSRAQDALWGLPDGN